MVRKNGLGILKLCEPSNLVNPLSLTLPTIKWKQYLMKIKYVYEYEVDSTILGTVWVLNK